MAQQNYRRHAIWLWNRGHEAFLRAHDDGQGVSFHPELASRNSEWYVDMVITPWGTIVRFQSAAYGRYLAAMDPLLGPSHRYFRAGQSDYGSPEEMAACRWWIFKVSPSSISIVIVHLPQGDGRKYFLRANGANEGVTVEEMISNSQMMYWVMVPIPETYTLPLLPFPSQSLCEQLWRRQIRFVRAGSDWSIDETAWETFEFLGRSVFNLRRELARRMGELASVQFTMCVRAGRRATLTVLVVDLPRAYYPMDIVVLLAGSPVVQYVTGSRRRLTDSGSSDASESGSSSPPRTG